MNQAKKLCAPAWYLGYIASSDDGREEGDPQTKGKRGLSPNTSGEMKRNDNSHGINTESYCSCVKSCAQENG